MTDIDHFKNLLSDIAIKHKFKDYELIINEVSSDGANYTSKLYAVTIKEGDNETKLFAKVAAVGEKLRSQGPKFYVTERFFYTELALVYDELEEQSGIADEFKLSYPKFYGCNPVEYEETIVLEDLVAQGYSPFDRFKSVDWPYASSAIGQLAKLHALAFAYGIRRPEEYQALLARLKFEWDTSSDSMTAYMKNVVERGILLTNNDNRPKMEAFYKTFDSDGFIRFFKEAKKPVLTHGDFRPSNLMDRKRNDGKIDIKIVDLQTLSGGSPVIDLLYFIFTGSDEQFRAAHYHQLLDHYYEELSQAMRRLQLDPDTTYSREEFDLELKEKLPFGLTIAVFALPIVTVEAENAPKVNEELDIPSMSVMKTSDLYTERLNGVVNDYVKWGILT